MNKTEDTTTYSTTDDDTLTTTGDDELTTTDYDYDYSDLEELWNKYYNEQGYSTTDDLDEITTDGYDDLDSSYKMEELVDTVNDGMSHAIDLGAFSGLFGFLSSMIVVVVILNILYAVYMAIVKFMISKKMGRSTGFAVASIFFWPITGGVLAFSKNKATENKDEGTPTAAPKPPVEPVEAEEVPGAPIQPSRG